MQEFAGLTPQDFRNAWPEAYRNAISQVAILMECCEHQLGRATAQVMWSCEATENATRQLETSRSVLAEALERATHDGNRRLQVLAQAIEKKTIDLVRREQALAAAQIDQDRRMNAQYAALRKHYFYIVDAPISTRLRWALGSRRHRLQFIRKSMEADK